MNEPTDRTRKASYCTTCFNFAEQELYAEKCPVKRTLLYLDFHSERSWYRWWRQKSYMNKLATASDWCRFCGAEQSFEDSDQHRALRILRKKKSSRKKVQSRRMRVQYKRK